VAQVAVVGVPDARWGEVGMAFVAPAPGAELGASELLAGLTGRLARYKIPKHVRVQPELPLTASGKLDRVALRARALAELSP
jgi:fatty-acyl-CoA synthase